MQILAYVDGGGGGGGYGNLKITVKDKPNNEGEGACSVQCASMSCWYTSWERL